MIINHINTEKVEFDYCVRNGYRYPSKFTLFILTSLSDKVKEILGTKKKKPAAFISSCGWGNYSEFL